MTGSLCFMRLASWSRRPGHASLSQLRSPVVATAATSATGDKRGDNRRDLSCPPSTCEGGERGAEGSNLNRPLLFGDGATLESHTESATPEKRIRKPSRRTNMQEPNRPDVGGALCRRRRRIG